MCDLFRASPARVPRLALLLALASLVGRAAAHVFFHRNEFRISEGIQVRYMLEELEGSLGKAHRRATERRIARLQDVLRPTVASLPKDANGNLGRMAVRYALHRIFVEKHAWYVQGLAPSGGAWNEFSLNTMLQGMVSTKIFERHMDNNTFGLHELAVLAATLENLVHEEGARRLREAYLAQGLPVERAGLHEAEFERAILTYLVMYISETRASVAADVLQDEQSMKSLYPAWPETVQFARDIRNEVFDRSDTNTSSLTFGDAMKVVEEISERYGRWHDRECRELKHTLVKIEIPGTGRVLLKDFYTSGQWQFSETAPYLKRIGALDDTDPKRMKVIIPNYVNAPSNCLSPSNFYSVCCIHECEALMGHIERKISAPDATAERVMEVVAALPSATMEAPRQLPPSLRSRLDEIASHHGHGRVPIHGRLFAQFMHHAYPRECIFPHVSGTTRPLTRSEWLTETNSISIRATKEDIRQHVEDAAAGEHDGEDLLPWTAEEELFCGQHGGQLFPGRTMMWVALALAVSFTFLRKRIKRELGKVYI